VIVVDDRGHLFLRSVAEEVRRLPIGDVWIYTPGDAEPRKTYEVKTIRDFWSRVSRGEINFQLGVSALLLIGDDPPEEEFDLKRWFQVVNGVNRKVPVYRFVDEAQLLKFVQREEEHLMKGDYDVLELRAPKIVSFPEHVQALSVLPGVSAVRSSFQVLLFLAGFVVLLVTGIFFSILTVQKTQALTLLRAVGASAGYLLRNLLLQVLLVTLGGIGVAAGLLALAASVSTPDFPIDADPGLILATGSATLVLALAASIASIRRVRRLDPAGATTRMAGGGLA